MRILAMGSSKQFKESIGHHLLAYSLAGTAVGLTTLPILFPVFIPLDKGQ